MRAIALCIAAIAVAACVRLPYSGGAHVVAPAARLDEHWLQAAPTPAVVQRTESDCGLAGLAMMAGAWGQQWSLDELTRAVSTAGGGATLGALRDYARAHALDAYAIAASPRDLARELGAGRPVLLGLVLPFDRGHVRSHYEVAVAFDPKTGSVITIDPASGRWMQRARDVLEIEWKPSHHAALVVLGPRERPRARAGASPAST